MSFDPALLKNLIQTYQPTKKTVELVQQTRLTLLVGISGAGKDTIKQQLLHKPDYHDIVSHTTRSPRYNNGVLEVDGLDYHFINGEKALDMLEHHRFIEAKFVHGTVYGTSVEEVKKSYDQHKIAVTDIDVQGVDEYKKLSSGAIAIFILPPNYATWRRRLAKRYDSKEDFEAEWPKRRASAIKELAHALEVPYYHFIVNDELSRSVRVTDEIAHRLDVYYREDDEARLVARDLLSSISRPATN